MTNRRKKLMNSKLGPIQPYNYGAPGDRKVNYFLDGTKHFCHIINGNQHLMVENGWYEHYHLADLDPVEVNGPSKREYLKEVLDGVDWEHLEDYPNSALGVNLDDAFHDLTGKGAKQSYHYKLNGMKRAGLMFVWEGPGTDLTVLNTTDERLKLPKCILGTDGAELATFNWELMLNRGFFLADWWTMPKDGENSYFHVVITHVSNFLGGE